MDRVHVIRDKVLREGRSIRSVARELGVSRVTVRKYVEEIAPVRVAAKARSQPAREQVRERFEELWSEWKGRSSAKQRITGSRVHRQLIADGFSISAVTVRRMVRELRLAEAEVFVPLVHRPGDSGQVDFFEMTVRIAGESRKVWMFLLHLPSSGRSFCRLYERCDQLSFLDGHVRAFERLGGLPDRPVYDNLKAAVKRRVAGDLELSDRFLSLLSHYVLEACFARPGEGHDKGSVERRGQTIRTMYFAPHPEGANLSEISDRVQDLMDTDWRASGGASEPLRELPQGAFDPRLPKTITVRKESTIRVEAALYSVPSQWARRSVQVLIGVDELEISCGTDRIQIPRIERGGRRIEYRHYLPELAKKPQAVRQIAPELVDELGAPYGHLWDWLSESHGPREAARVLSRVLLAILDHGEQSVGKAISDALEEGRLDLLALREDEPRPSVAVPAELAGHVIEATAAESFDGLLLGATS